MTTTIKLTVCQYSEYDPAETQTPINRTVLVRYEPKFDPKESTKELHDRAFRCLHDEFCAWMEEKFAGGGG